MFLRNPILLHISRIFDWHHSAQFDWFKFISYVNWIESDDWMLRQHIHKSILLRWWVYENEKLITCTLIWTSILLFIIIITRSETVGMLITDDGINVGPNGNEMETSPTVQHVLLTHRISQSPPNFEIVASASRANLNGWMRFDCNSSVAQETQRTSINACVYIDKSRVWMHCEDSALQ